MTIPKKLKIGGFQVEIRQIKGLPDDGNMTETTILIREDLSPNEKELTLIHELLHKINPNMHEEIVEYISRALHQIFHDNKMLK